MNPDRQLALDYLRAPGDGLWHWAEAGAVLVWHDGTTIAFREEVGQILAWLAPNGLPDFGAIVFLLAAGRGKVPQVSEIAPEAAGTAVKLPAKLGKDAGLLLAARKQLAVQLEAALDELRKVSRLPAEVNAGLKARCVLAEAVFEAAKNERRTVAAAVLAGLREPMTDADLRQGDLPYAGNYIRQVHVVAEGLKRHSAESLALRMRTGLDALPKAIDTNLPPTDQARQLIAELSRDAELGAVARAARELLAALRLPRRLAEAEELSSGGVADITNRGPLDRLLLSELAHDDLTLSVRVALNEALYLRREPPRREPPGALCLLLDSGVRLWGVPRVLAAAVALALIAREKQHHKISASRAHKAELAVVDLLSRNGLMQHLSALETEAHPGTSLPAFAALTAADPQNQSVLITHRDTLADPEFRRLISEHSGAVGFIATVDREGHFELHALPLSHRPPLCAAELDLAAIFGEKTGVAAAPVKVDPAWPAIFGMQPFPLLLPLGGKVDYWIEGDDGFKYAVLNDRRLVRFHGDQTGGRTFATDLPNGKTLWMGLRDSTLHLVKAGASPRPTRLVAQPLPDGKLWTIDLVSGEEVKAVHAYGDAVVLIRNTDVRAHSLSDGRLLQRVLNPHRWVHGRYFAGQSQFYFVVWDGTSLKFESVTIPKECSFRKIAGVFDRQGMEGPWILDTNGEAVSTATGEKIMLKMPTGFDANTLKVSRDGHRLHLPMEPWGGIFDLKTNQFTNCPKVQSAFHSLEPAPPLPTRNLFHNFEAIARLPDGMGLLGRNKKWRKLTLNVRGELHHCEATPKDQSEVASKRPFSISPQLTPQGYSLRLAEWPGGSKAFLDKRGLLHLKSHDPNVPEISLVLTDGLMAGWAADGQVCGPKFFFEGNHTSEPLIVFGRIMAFLNQL